MNSLRNAGAHINTPIFIKEVVKNVLVSEIKAAISVNTNKQISDYINKISKSDLKADEQKLEQLTPIVGSTCAYYLVNMPALLKTSDVTLAASVYDLKLSSEHVERILKILAS